MPIASVRMDVPACPQGRREALKVRNKLLRRLQKTEHPAVIRASAGEYCRYGRRDMVICVDLQGPRSTDVVDQLEGVPGMTCISMEDVGLARRMELGLGYRHWGEAQRAVFRVRYPGAPTLSSLLQGPGNRH